jgi:hypothetical protein
LPLPSASVMRRAGSSRYRRRDCPTLRSICRQRVSDRTIRTRAKARIVGLAMTTAFVRSSLSWSGLAQGLSPILPLAPAHLISVLPKTSRTDPVTLTVHTNSRAKSLGDSQKVARPSRHQVGSGCRHVSSDSSAMPKYFSSDNCRLTKSMRSSPSHSFPARLQAV